MSAEQIACPVFQTLDRVVIHIFGRAADQEAVAYLFRVFVLSPAIAGFAERHFVPLLGLMVVARLRKFLALPNLPHTLLKDIAHISGSKPVEAAQAHAAVMMDRHALVDD